MKKAQPYIIRIHKYLEKFHDGLPGIFLQIQIYLGGVWLF